MAKLKTDGLALAGDPPLPLLICHPERQWGTSVGSLQWPSATLPTVQLEQEEERPLSFDLLRVYCKALQFGSDAFKCGGALWLRDTEKFRPGGCGPWDIVLRVLVSGICQ